MTKFGCFVCRLHIRRSKGEVYFCRCGKVLCARHTYSYVDESNRAITKNSPDMCEECYKEKYKII